MKRLIAAALALSLCVPTAMAADGGPSFSDVPADAWYAPYVSLCVEKGLLNGTGDGTFHPLDRLSSEEAIVIAARLHWRSQGNTDALPKGPSPEALKTTLGPTANDTIFDGSILDSDLDQLAAGWAWDGIAYLAQQGKTVRRLPAIFKDRLSSSTDRWRFFDALVLGAMHTDLPRLNRVTALPDSKDEGILKLYQTGILAGGDACGSFYGGRALTRAEAAAALARIADPTLRLSFTLQPAPAKGYTLTYLADGDDRYGCNTVFCRVDREAVYDLDRNKIALPRYCLPAIPSEKTDPYLPVTSITDSTQYGLLDRDGLMVTTPGAYDSFNATQDGHIVAKLKEVTWLLDKKGSKLNQLTAPEGLSPQWDAFNEGVAPCGDPGSAYYGYVDQTGAWVLPPQWVGATAFSNGYAVVYNDQGSAIIDHTGRAVVPYQGEYLGLFSNNAGYSGVGLFQVDGDWVSPTGERSPGTPGQTPCRNGYTTYPAEDGIHYQNLTTNAVSEGFQWCGPIDANGRGFVGREGKVYRIDFRR